MSWGDDIALFLLAVVVGLLFYRLHRLESIVEDMLTLARPQGCSHPDVINVGTFGHPEYECVMCHQPVLR